MLAGGATSLSARGGIRWVTGAELAVAQTSTPSMAVLVGAGMAWVPGTNTTGQGAYVVTVPTAATLTIAAANATNPRIDLVVLKVLDQQYAGSVSQGQLAVVTGTPSVSPAAPAAPASSIPLGQVRVNANATTVVNANITDLRQSTSLFGGVSVVSAADTTNGSYVGALRYHPTFRLQAWDGTRWVSSDSPPRLQVSGTGLQAIGNNVDSVVVLNSVINSHGGVSYSTSTGRLTVSVPGWYLISGGVSYPINEFNDTGFRAASLAKNGTVINSTTATAFGTAPPHTVQVGSIPTLLSLSGTDFVTLVTKQVSGQTINVNKADSLLMASYMGSL
jgi:hypothetical protein